jgi:hypothetical protein
MKIKLIIIFIILFLPVQILPSGGSVYSRFGLGDYYFSFSARRLALGELGIATTDIDYLNYLNPASWNKMRLSRFETGIITHGKGISSNNASVFHVQTIFSGMMFGFPIDRELGLSFAAGIVPYSNVNYDVVYDASDPIAGSYQAQNKGSGGLSKAFFGLSIRLPHEFALGASFDYYAGKIEHISSVAFGPESELLSASFSRHYSYNGLGFTVGIISPNFSGLFGSESIKDFRLGVVYSTKSSMNTDTSNISSTLLGDIETSTGSMNTNLPYRLGAGLSLIMSNGLNFTADYLFQQSSKFNVAGKTLNVMRDFTKYSLGVEYRNPEPRFQSFWEQVMLRIGFSFEQTQYVFNGKGIDQFSLYTGFSLPLDFDNTLDVGFQYGKRGTKENNLLSENFYKFSITLSIGELWFIQTER